MISSLITLLSMPGGSEWIIIALVVLLLFGGKKIPELMKGMGKGVRSFKEGMNEVSNELKDTPDKTNENSSENSSK
jgi:sec-independent protein translocase protein TatA